MYIAQIISSFPSRMFSTYFKEVVIAQNRFRTSLWEGTSEPKKIILIVSMMANPKELLQKYFENKIIRLMPLEGVLWSGKSSLNVSASSCFPCSHLLPSPHLRHRLRFITLGDAGSDWELHEGKNCACLAYCYHPNSQHRAQAGQGPQGMLAEWRTEWMNEWVTQWVNEWMVEWMAEWIDDWMSKLMNEWMSEWVSEWVNEWGND